MENNCWLTNWLAEFNAPEKDWSYETFLGFEDYLTIDHKVFEGGSMLAYGTTLNYSKLNKALTEFRKDRISSEGWRLIVKHFRGFWYLSPIAGMVSAEIARFAGLPSPLDRDEKTENFYQNDERKPRSLQLRG